MEITVLTATYNRCDKIKELFRSLSEQSSHNFNWLIIDDGSQDETEDTITELIRECELFSIRYFKKDNGGKHTAINYGLTKVDTEYCLIVDSDDILKSHAIEFFLRQWQTLNDDIAAISCLAESKNGVIVGNLFPLDGMEINHIEQVYGLNIHGDKIECYRTDVLQKNQFPSFNNERFLTEAVVWNRIGMRYRKKCFNNVLMIHEYYNDGLTSNLEKLHKNSVLGSFLYHYEISNLDGVPADKQYKHRCIAMKYFCHFFIKQSLFNLLALPVGLVLMLRSFFK